MNESEFINYVKDVLKDINVKMQEQMYLNWYSKEQLKDMTLEFLQSINKMEEC